MPGRRDDRRTLIPFRVWLLAAFLVLLALSAIDPPHADDFLWEHLLTVAALVLLGWLEFRGHPLSNYSNTLIFVYMLLHVLGAHYTYSAVPYDRWFNALLGTGVGEAMDAPAPASDGGSGSGRNHYDRLVHTTFGLLLLRPMSELVERWLNLRGVTCLIVAAAFLCVLGTIYELLEWIYAAVMGQEAAELYNGQQGDPFDAQKDVALNMAGSLVAGTFISANRALAKR